MKKKIQRFFFCKIHFHRKVFERATHFSNRNNTNEKKKRKKNGPKYRKKNKFIIREVYKKCNSKHPKKKTLVISSRRNKYHIKSVECKNESVFLTLPFRKIMKQQ